MREAMNSEENRKKYQLRKQTVEPVFGIFKNVFGFRQFNLHRLSKVTTEWTLLALAYNGKRLHRLKLAKTAYMV